MRCPYCHHLLNRTAAYCPHCGKPVSQNSCSTEQINRKAKSISSLWVVLFVLLMLLLIGGLFFFLFRQKTPLSPSLDTYTEINQKLSSIEEPYLDEEGFVSSEDSKILLEEVFAYIQTLYEQGMITDCSYTDGDTAVYYQIDNWLGCLYLPQIKDMLSGSSSDVQIVTIEPYHSDLDMWFNSKFAGFLSNIIKAGEVLNTDDVANKLVQYSENFVYEQDYHDEEATIDLLYNLNLQNSILIWQGHGGYLEKFGSLLSLNAKKWKPTDFTAHQQEFADDALLLCSNDVVAVTSLFFEKELADNSLKNSLIYLNTCASLKDHMEGREQKSLAQAILDKGASCVIGNTDSVNIWYAYAMQDAIFDDLQSRSSDDTPTRITEAINTASDLWGSNSDNAYVWAVGTDITLDDLLTPSGKDNDSSISTPLSAADVNWIVEPTYDYQQVIPLRGRSFSDISGPYSDGKTVINEQFYEMSFPGYSNLPQYYQVQMADGSWRFYYMPDHGDSGNIPVDQNANPESSIELRYDASGIINLAAITSDSASSQLYYLTQHYPTPWYLFTSAERGSGTMHIYYDTYSKQALADGEFYGSFFTPVETAGLHKPYPAGKINTEKSAYDVTKSFSVPAGTDEYTTFNESTLSTIEEFPKGYIDTNGKPITDFIYTAAEDFSEGIAACCRDGKWGYIDETGKEITDFIYNGIWAYRGEYDPNLAEFGGFTTEYAAYPCTSDTMVVWQDDKVGLLYRNGQTLIEFGEFEDMAPAYNNELWAKQDGLWGLIDLAAAKRKAGVTSMLTSMEPEEIPDPEYKPYVNEQYPETVSFDYPAKESQVYDFYQEVSELQYTIASTPMYTSPNGNSEIITIPQGELVQVYGSSQSHPEWLCVEWNIVESERTYIGDWYFDNNRISNSFYGWVLQENLIP